MRVVRIASLALLTLLARGAWAQETERGSLGTLAVVAGEFVPEEPHRLDAGTPVIGMRFARTLTRIFVAEAALSYALGNHGSTPNEPRVIAADIGVQAQLPHRWYRPYIGGALGTLRGSAAGSRRLVPAMAGAVGAWLGATPNVTLLAEIRVRSPLRSYAPGGSEQTIGVAWRI
jgi:hypothetical protein